MACVTGDTTYGCAIIFRTSCSKYNVFFLLALLGICGELHLDVMRVAKIVFECVGYICLAVLAC